MSLKLDRSRQTNPHQKHQLSEWLYVQVTLAVLLAEAGNAAIKVVLTKTTVNRIAKAVLVFFCHSFSLLIR